MFPCGIPLLSRRCCALWENSEADQKELLVFDQQLFLIPVVRVQCHQPKREKTALGLQIHRFEAFDRKAICRGETTYVAQDSRQQKGRLPQQVQRSVAVQPGQNR